MWSDNIITPIYRPIATHVKAPCILKNYFIISITQSFIFYTLWLN